MPHKPPLRKTILPRPNAPGSVPPWAKPGFQPDFKTSNVPIGGPPPDPMLALRKAKTIGAPGIGSREELTENPDIPDLVGAALGGRRPASVASQDPYGIKAWERGSGVMPVLAAPIEPHGVPTTLQQRIAMELADFLGDVPGVRRLFSRDQSDTGR